MPRNRRFDDDYEDDDDDFDDAPRRPRKKPRKLKKKPQGPPVGLIVGGSVGALVVVGLVIFLVVKVAGKKSDSKSDQVSAPITNTRTVPAANANPVDGNAAAANVPAGAAPPPQAPQITVVFTLSNLRKERDQFQKSILLVDYEYTASDTFVASQYQLCIKDRSSVSRVRFTGFQGGRDTMRVQEFGGDFRDNFTGAFEVWIESGGKRVSEVLTGNL
jgi:hypothetical protein